MRTTMTVTADNITTGSMLPQGSKPSYVWVKNVGTTAVYVAMGLSDTSKSVDDLITEYETAASYQVAKLEAQASTRLAVGSAKFINLFAKDDGLVEVDFTNTDVSPFKVQAKGGDDGNIEPISITDNGTYTASGNVKGYSPVTVAVSKDFYPKAHATLDDASRVEGDDMRVYPIGGTDYYPYVYLGAMPYPAQQGDDYEPCGKYFAGQTQEHTVTTFLDLIDVTTGESVSGYPQRVASNWSVSIVDGGYMKIVSWTVKASGAVSVTTERYNPTYTKPLQDTKDSAAVTGGKLDAYVDASYYIDGGAGESVLLQSLTATANGTYTAPARTAYNEVTVDVQEQPWQPLEDGYSNFWFELTNDTLSPWLNFTEKNNDAVIDWGDGSGEVALDTLTPTHTYAKAGKYIVKVKGVTGLGTQNLTASTDYTNVLRYIECNSEVITVTGVALKYCLGLKEVVFAATITLGSNAFQIDTVLKNVGTLKTSAISQGCFYQCLSLKNIVLQGTTIINTSSFYSCLSLEKIILPSTITEIGQLAFSTCTALSEIHCQATTPPTLGTNAFQGLPSNYIIYVPIGYGETYKSAAGWSTYADHILEEGQTPNRAMLSRLAKETDTDEDMR